MLWRRHDYHVIGQIFAQALIHNALSCRRVHTSPLACFAAKIDYYKVLGITRNASQKEVKRAYIELAKKYHPDANQGNEDASKRFQEIAVAYTVLSSQTERKAYDETFFNDGAKDFESFRRSTSSYQSPYETFHSSINPEELFKKIFGVDFKESYAKKGDREWVDYSATGFGYESKTETTIVRLTFREAAKGCEKIITARTLTVCEKCLGIGSEPGRSLQLCPFCDGIGYEIVEGVDERFRVSCRFCNGKGHNVVHKCTNCLGYGRTLVERKVVVPIPGGVTDGETFKINVSPSEGDVERGTADEPQHIFLRFTVEPSDYFTVDGIDLHSMAPISISQAVFGGSITVDGLWCEEKVRLEPGTDSHTTIRLENKGLKDNMSAKFGHHYVHVKIVAPKELTSEEDKLLRRYASIENLTIGEIDNIQKDKKHPVESDGRAATDEEIEEKERAQMNVERQKGTFKFLVTEFFRPAIDLWKRSKIILSLLSNKK